MQVIHQGFGLNYSSFGLSALSRSQPLFTSQVTDSFKNDFLKPLSINQQQNSNPHANTQVTSPNPFTRKPSASLVSSNTFPSLAFGSVLDLAIQDDDLDVLYPTPPALIDRMVELADIRKGQRVLEPSAGPGDIADAMQRLGARVTVVEMMPKLAAALRKKGYHEVIEDNFLAYNPLGLIDPKQMFDRIVMNPPYGFQLEIAHVEHAYELLAPGGRLVALVPKLIFEDHRPEDHKGKALWDTYYLHFRDEPTGRLMTTQFRRWLKSMGNRVSILEVDDNAFRDIECKRKTDVETRILILNKPKW